MSLGPIIDESNNPRYVNDKNSAKAKQILLLVWLVVGFLLTVSYKSVLLSNLVNIGYEKTIDTVDDMLNSEKVLYSPGKSMLPTLIKGDPRPKVKSLTSIMEIGDFIKARSPKKVQEGYVFF